MDLEVFKAKKGIRYITVTNDIGLEVILSSYGASIYSIKLDLELMSVTPKLFDDFYNSSRYYGKTIGRVAGRIKNGQIKVNDKIYELDKNEGSNCLHGGFKAISNKVWGTQIKKSGEGITVAFYLTTKNKECGFNGRCEYKVTYNIAKNENNINVKYHAKCNQDTYFNLTNHTYFNLGNQKDILNHRLMVKASKVSTFDYEDFTINGEEDVVDSIFDFRTPKLIKKDINSEILHSNKWLNGFDHRFRFDELDDLESCIVLDCGNYKLNVTTDFNAVHVYTSGFTNEVELIDESKDITFKGIALECCNFEPEFIDSKDSYEHVIKYKFRRKSDEI